MFYIVVKNKVVIHECSSLRIAKEVGTNNNADVIMAFSVEFIEGAPTVKADMFYVHAKNIGRWLTYSPGSYYGIQKFKFGGGFYIKSGQSAIIASPGVSPTE